MSFSSNLLKPFDIDNVSTLPFLYGRFSRLWCFSEDVSHVCIHKIANCNVSFSKFRIRNGAIYYNFRYIN